MKNYIGIIRDHSGSMHGLAATAARDYNGVISAIKAAAIREGQDTLVFVTKFGETQTEIGLWAETYIGQRLPVTCEKDRDMIELWDDRAIGLIPNTGERADGKP